MPSPESSTAPADAFHSCGMERSQSIHHSTVAAEPAPFESDSSPPPKTSNALEKELNAIWCTLVFRMICWLLLHDFDKEDVQKPKSELLGSRLPVYIL
jgi:hypothetical protein